MNMKDTLDLSNKNRESTQKTTKTSGEQKRDKEVRVKQCLSYYLRVCPDNTQRATETVIVVAFQVQTRYKKYNKYRRGSFFFVSVMFFLKKLFVAHNEKNPHAQNEGFFFSPLHFDVNLKTEARARERKYFSFPFIQLRVSAVNMKFSISSLEPTIIHQLCEALCNFFFVQALAMMLTSVKLTERLRLVLC